jgi:hypothetical protein
MSAFRTLECTTYPSLPLSGDKQTLRGVVGLSRTDGTQSRPKQDFSAITIARLADQTTGRNTGHLAGNPERAWMRQSGLWMSKRKEPAGSWSVKLLVAAAVVACGALLGWELLAARNDAAIEAQRERTIKVPIRVSGKNSDPVITLKAETQQRSGIEIAALPSTPHPEELRAYGMVLDVARLMLIARP